MRKMLLLLLGGLLLSAQLLAQTRTISGKITDETGAPLPNVSVIVKGTSTGTTTKEDGTFSLTIPANAKALEFSIIGYKARTVNITGSHIYSFSMSPSEDKNLAWMR